MGTFSFILLPLLAATLVTATLGAADSRAEPLATASLEYVKKAGAESCPNEEVIRRGVAARLGREGFDASADRRLRVEMSGHKLGFSARINVYDASGELAGTRSIATAESDCGELVHAMELAIAIAIDPLYTLGAGQAPVLVAPEPVVPVVAAPVPAVLEHAPMTSSPALLSEPEPEHRIAVGLVVAVSTEPEETFGLTFAYRKQYRSLAWGAEARFDTTREMPVAPGHVETGLLHASGLLCHVGSLVDVCVIASLGVLRSEGIGFSETSATKNPYVAGGARVCHHFSLTKSLGIDVGVDLVSRANHVTLYVDNNDVWESSPFELSVGARGVWSISHE